MSNRRKLRPRETARQDQAFAEAREVGRQPRTVSIAIGYAAADTQCSWCDCPDDAEVHRKPGGVCPGCDQPAVYLVQVVLGDTPQNNYPVCAGHLPDVQRFMASLFPGVQEMEIHKRPILDEEL